MHFLLFFSLKVYFLHFYCTLYTYLSSVNYILVVVREKERGNRMTSRLAIPPLNLVCVHACQLHAVRLIYDNYKLY